MYLIVLLEKLLVLVFILVMIMMMINHLFYIVVDRKVVKEDIFINQINVLKIHQVVKFLMN